MERIELEGVNRLRVLANKVYELGKRRPTERFDAAVDELIRCLDSVCALLEEIGQDAASRRQTVGVENIQEAVQMTDAARIAIESVQKYYGWGYGGTHPGRRESMQEDGRVVGLMTLKRRFDELKLHLLYQQVRVIVRKTLAERFLEDEFVFEPVVVSRTPDKFGDNSAYLRIVIVFDGDQGRLDPAWTSGFLTRIQPKLIDAGIEEFPSVSFIEKSEWWDSYAELQRRNPEETQLIEFPAEAKEPAAGSGRRNRSIPSPRLAIWLAFLRMTVYLSAVFDGQSVRLTTRCSTVSPSPAPT